MEDDQTKVGGIDIITAEMEDLGPQVTRAHANFTGEPDRARGSDKQGSSRPREVEADSLGADPLARLGGPSLGLVQTARKSLKPQ